MYTYLLINLFVISIPLIFSFERKIYFAQKFRYLFPAMAVSGAIFILWDHIFTKLGVWGFNPYYLIDINVFGLPLEEILFFVCVPFSCVFIFELVLHFEKKNYLAPFARKISIILAVILLGVGIFSFSKLYTAVTFLSLSCFLFYHVFKIKADYMGFFYEMYLISLIPFLLVNGILTNGLRFIHSGPVVWYNNTQNLGLRIIGIPIEDFAYSMFLLLLNITIYEYLKTQE